MKTKHTKGEWKVEVSKFGLPSAPDLTYRVYVDERNPICGLASKMSNPKEAEANAKLIAAAPKLLEALQMAVNILECKNGYHKKFDNPRSIEEMKSAIAKATNQNSN